MLPFRLRPPVYGSKLKKEIQERRAKAGDTTPLLIGGGPVQVAIEKDLLELRRDYLQALKPPQQECQQPSLPNHSKKGYAFGVFQTVFTEAKIALLHTKYMPGRSDQAGCEQLIYAACLSLIQNAMQQEPAQVDHASFGLFCLYTLFETNPLPECPPTKMAWLPMGLQSAENPRLKHRRAFRTPIRIDRYHYTLLLQLREEALAVKADCHNEWIQQSLQGLERRMTGQLTEESSCGWSCRCGIATDAIHVLGRVFPNLDLCEYTGPGCLEGIAGHADYPYPHSKPNKTQQEQLLARQICRTSQPLGDELIRTAGTPSLSLPATQDIGPTLKSYRSTLQTICISSTLTNQKVAVLKEALNPILQSSEPTLEALLSQISSGEVARAARRGCRRVTWEAVGDEGGEAGTGTTPQNAKHSTKQPSVVKQDMTYELEVPGELPEALHWGIQEALQVRLKRDQPIFLPTVDSAKTATQADGANEVSDDVSSIGIGGVSVGQSLGIAPGDAALLARASSKSQASGTASFSQANAPSKASNPRRLDNFLYSGMDDDDEGSVDKQNGSESDTSNLSESDEDDDALSVATSAIGQRALTALLSSVSASKAQSTRARPTRKRGKKKQVPSHELEDEDEDTSQGETQSLVSGMGKTAVANLLNQAQSTKTGPTRQNGNKKRASSRNLEEATEDASQAETQSLVSGMGRAALSNLLSQAQSTTPMPAKRNKQQKRAAQSRESELEEATEDASMAETESLGSDVGKASLSNLLNHAQPTIPRPARRTQQTQRKAPFPDLEEVDQEAPGETESVASGQGKAALSNLLSQAQSGARRSIRQMKPTRWVPPAPEDASHTESMASGQGKSALSNLLRQAQSSTGTTSTRQRKPTQRWVPPAPEDSSNTETESVASGQGKAALSNLLSQAQSSSRMSSRQGKPTQRWGPPAPEDTSYTETESVASGQGQAALSNLLSQAQSSATRSTTIKRRPTLRWALQEAEDASHTETESLASGQGKAALSNHLSQAQSGARRSTRQRKPTNRWVPPAPADASQTEMESVASGRGRAALSNLLSQARSNTMSPTSQRPQKRRRVQSPDLEEATKNASQVETESLISGQGRAALTNPLQQAQSNKGKGTAPRPSPCQKEKRKLSCGVDESADDATESASLASGAGRAALSNLLAMAGSNQGMTKPGASQRNKTKKSQGGQKSSHARKPGVQEPPDDESQADSLASGQGKAALASLLTMAGSGKAKAKSRKPKRKHSDASAHAYRDDGGNLTNENSLTTDSQGGGLMGNGRLVNVNDRLAEAAFESAAVDDEDTSVRMALSGLGTSALDALPSQVQDDSEAMPPPKQRKRTKSS